MSRQLVGQFYREKQKMEAVKNYFEAVMEQQALQEVKAGNPTEHYGKAFKLINSVFSAMRKDFEPPKPKKVVNENR